MLPLRRLCPRWLSLQGLMLGSLTPDLGYYAGQLGFAAFSHTPAGIVACCLPLGLLLLALLLRFSRQLTVLLPAPHRQACRSQLQPMPQHTWLACVVAAQSVVLGAASHVAWDSFTHGNRWGVSLWPALSLPVFAAGGRQFLVYNVLQHVSTAVGVVALAIVYRRFVRSWARAAPAPSPRREALRARLLLAGAACSVALGALAAGVLTLASPTSLSHVVVHAVVCSTACFGALFLAGSLAWWRRLGDA